MFISAISVVSIWILLCLTDNKKAISKNLTVLKQNYSGKGNIKETIGALSMVQDFIEIAKKRPTSYEGTVVSGLADSLHQKAGLFRTSSFNQSPRKQGSKAGIFNKNSNQRM